MKSELTERLISICAPSDASLQTPFGIDNLTKEQRTLIEEELIKHFEFKKIVWMDLPSGLDESGNPIVAKSIKISDSDNPTYKHKVGYVYTISFTPKMYDPGEMYKPVKDGCVFGPIVYNPETFEPKQSITLTWSPDFPQDINAPVRTYEDDKQMIRDMLEKVLDNPEEYRPEGYRAGRVRVAGV